MKFLALVILVLSSSVISAEPSESVCGKESPVNYCFYPGSKSSDKLVVYMHGVIRTSKDWEQDKVTREIAKDWAGESELKRPHVISISRGRYWWYENEQDGKDLTQALKNIENRYLKGLNLSRRLLGDSMGGHNSLRWASDHIELFDQLIAICPAIPKTFTDLRKGSEGTWPFSAAVERVFRGLYPQSQQQAKVQVSDMFNLEKLRTLNTVHIAATPRDHYGFFSGNYDLMTQLKEKMGSRLSYQEEKVRHCLVSGKVIAEKLVF